VIFRERRSKKIYSNTHYEYFYSDICFILFSILSTISRARGVAEKEKTRLDDAHMWAWNPQRESKTPEWVNLHRILYG
jgi:hypothetical protein